MEGVGVSGDRGDGLRRRTRHSEERCAGSGQICRAVVGIRRGLASRSHADTPLLHAHAHAHTPTRLCAFVVGVPAGEVDDGAVAAHVVAQAAARAVATARQLDPPACAC